MKRAKPSALSLTGLELAPSQSWGAVRLVPVLRSHCPGDFRLRCRGYDEDLTWVDVKGSEKRPKSAYVSYVPHALVMSWTSDTSPVVAMGTQLTARDGKVWGRAVRVMHRMARRENDRQLRVLPLHLAMEGFLQLHFGGPDVAWSEYSERALRHGLSPRVEYSARGHGIAGLADALRIFEMHETQVGVLLFVADALASAFIVSHPDDYRALHRTLLQDFYAELLVQYGLYGTLAPLAAELDAAEARTIEDLRRALSQSRQQWASFHAHMAEGLLGRPILSERVYRAGPFLLSRFCTALERSTENHIGEMVQRPDGTIEYLKTFRLSAAQTRRAFLLRSLAEQQWNLAATAATQRQSVEELSLRLEKAGFGYLLKPHVLEEARRRR